MAGCFFKIYFWTWWFWKKHLAALPFFWGGEVFGAPDIYNSFFSSQQFLMIETLLEFLSAFLFLFCVLPSSLSVMKLGEIFFGGIPTNNICWVTTCTAQCTLPETVGVAQRGGFSVFGLVRGLVKWQVASWRINSFQVWWSQRLFFLVVVVVVHLPKVGQDEWFATFHEAFFFPEFVWQKKMKKRHPELHSRGSMAPKYT